VGVEGLSLREVSRRAGVSHAAAYNHFRDKGTLMQALVDEAFDRLAADMRRTQAHASDSFDALRRLGVAYVRFAYKNPAEFKVMFRPELRDAGASGQPPSGAAYQLLVDAVLACQRNGTIAPGPPEPIIATCWSLVHGLSSLLVDGPDTGLATSLSAAESLARSCIDVLGRGLIAPPKATRSR
jgi:AcrR family transcriptional regulator